MALNAMLPDGHDAVLKFILVNECGGHEFLRPSIWLRDIRTASTPSLLLILGQLAPQRRQGFTRVNLKREPLCHYSRTQDSTGKRTETR